MELTCDQIDKINNDCPYGQGVFFQPNMIPVDVKELVIYSRYETGGYRDGNCYGDRPNSYQNEAPDDRFKVLDLVLKELLPNISYLQYKQIDALIKNNEETDREYYGNSTDWKVEYIVLSELIGLLESFE